MLIYFHLPCTWDMGERCKYKINKNDWLNMYKKCCYTSNSETCKGVIGKSILRFFISHVRLLKIVRIDRIETV